MPVCTYARSGGQSTHDRVTVLLDRVRSCSPMWPQTPPQPDLARRHSAPPEFPSSPSSKQELSALPDQPLRHFLYGLLGDTGRCSSEKHDDRESELRREGVHNFLAVCRFVRASRSSPTFIRWLDRRCRGTSSRCSCSATPRVSTAFCTSSRSCPSAWCARCSQCAKPTRPPALLASPAPHCPPRPQPQPPSPLPSSQLPWPPGYARLLPHALPVLRVAAWRAHRRCAMA